MNLKKLLMIALFSFGLVNSAFTKETTISHDTLINAAQALIYYQEENYEKAFPLLKESAEAGYDVHQFYLAKMYLNGWGVTKNNQKAIYWFQKSAEQGYDEAQLLLGAMYYRGRWVKQDRKKGIQYFKLACDNGNEEACGYYKKLTQ